MISSLKHRNVSLKLKATFLNLQDNEIVAIQLFKTVQCHELRDLRNHMKVKRFLTS